jgi:hypothetical protein
MQAATNGAASAASLRQSICVLTGALCCCRAASLVIPTEVYNIHFTLRIITGSADAVCRVQPQIVHVCGQHDTRTQVPLAQGRRAMMVTAGTWQQQNTHDVECQLCCACCLPATVLLPAVWLRLQLRVQRMN